jgi:hypothetical protein
MNSEFEWRNQMRKLGGPVEPERDLWPSIAARIASEPAQVPAPSRRARLGWIAIAATVLVAVGAALTAYRLPHVAPPSVEPTVAAVPPAPTPARADELPPGRSPSAPEAMDGREGPRTALDWAVPADPQLAATAQNLDNASAQLQSALEQRPDAVFLVGLLNRTNAQRLRLMRKSPYAG